MRGANRPLLTKLIHQEVDIEIRQEARDITIDVDFYSDKVIQVRNPYDILGLFIANSIVLHWEYQYTFLVKACNYVYNFSVEVTWQTWMMTT